MGVNIGKHLQLRRQSPMYKSRRIHIGHPHRHESHDIHDLRLRCPKPPHMEKDRDGNETTTACTMIGQTAGNGAVPVTLNRYGYCWGNPVGYTDYDRMKGYYFYDPLMFTGVDHNGNPYTADINKIVDADIKIWKKCMILR